MCDSHESENSNVRKSNNDPIIGQWAWVIIAILIIVGLGLIGYFMFAILGPRLYPPEISYTRQ